MLAGTNVQILTQRFVAATAFRRSGRIKQVPHFTCFYWYKSTNTDAEYMDSAAQSSCGRDARTRPLCGPPGAKFTCVYWYKSTNTDAKAPAVAAATHELDLSADHQERLLQAFTCFTSTKVQILTHELDLAADHQESLLEAPLLEDGAAAGIHFTCVTSVKVQKY